MQHIKWPSIEQFRNVVRNVTHRAQFVGKGTDGSPIMNRAALKPTLKFEGTVKLHGTNAAVCMGADGQMWFQSRQNIITPEHDNAGFASFAQAYSERFAELFSRIQSSRTKLIFGEWCGQGIQKRVAISELPKMFVIFGIDLVDGENRTHLTREQVKDICIGYNSSHAGQIFCIYDYPTYEMSIDFENPHEAQNALNKITDAVGSECPVGKSFGVSGIGEGVVWRCVDESWESSDYWFKVKDERHSQSKVKTLAAVDVERINNIRALAEKLANNGRLAQMHQEVFDTLNGGETDMKRMGDFLKAVMADIAKEESDTISENGFTTKDISKPVFEICRKFISEMV